MGFFSKLFGFNSSNEEEARTTSLRPQTHINNSIDHLSILSKFVGIDLKDIPNYEWKEEQPEVNSCGTPVRNFTLKATHRLSSLFYGCSAKVIGNSDTNIFFKSKYSWENVLDIFYYLEKEVKGQQSLTIQKAAEKLGGRLNSIYDDAIEWEFEHLTIMLRRDLDDEDIELVLFTNIYNAKYLNSIEAPKPKKFVTTPEGYALPEGFENWVLRFEIEMAKLPFFNECLWMEDGTPNIFFVMDIDGTIAVIDEDETPVLILDSPEFRELLAAGKRIFMACTDVKYGEEKLEVNAWFKIEDAE